MWRHVEIRSAGLVDFWSMMFKSLFQGEILEIDRRMVYNRFCWASKIPNQQFHVTSCDFDPYPGMIDPISASSIMLFPHFADLYSPYHGGEAVYTARGSISMMNFHRVLA